MVIQRLLLEFNILINYSDRFFTGNIIFAIFKISINPGKIVRILEFIDACRVNTCNSRGKYISFINISFGRFIIVRFINKNKILSEFVKIGSNYFNY